MRRVLAAVGLALAAALVLAVAWERERTDIAAPPAPAPGASAAPAPEARCPTSLANCRQASGRILYVERVDPDGDGDAHFVLLSQESITAPG